MPRSPYSLTAPLADAIAVMVVVGATSAAPAATGGWLDVWHQLATPLTYAVIWLVVGHHIGVYRAIQASKVRRSASSRLCRGIAR